MESRRANARENHHHSHRTMSFAVPSFSIWPNGALWWFSCRVEPSCSLLPFFSLSSSSHLNYSSALARRQRIPSPPDEHFNIFHRPRVRLSFFSYLRSASARNISIARSPADRSLASHQQTIRPVRRAFFLNLIVGQMLDGRCLPIA